MLLIVNRVTSDLLLLIVKKNKYVEASLNNGIFNATHFIRFGGRKYFVTGIDSKEKSWKETEFIEYYNNVIWKIDQIIK